MNGEALLFYDGECRICRRAVRLLEIVDRAGRIVCMPYQNPLVPRLISDVSLEEMSQEMLFLGPRGRRYRGAEALPRILSLLPGGFLLRLFFELPRATEVAHRVYRWVAGHRHALGCALPSKSTV